MSSNREKDALLSKARHNLKNPVNAILGFSEMLIEDCEDEGYDSIIPDLEKIHNAGKDILSIIESSFSDSNLKNSGDKISEIASEMEIALRTPINTVIGYSEMLQEDTEDIDLDTFSEDLEKIIKIAQIHQKSPAQVTLKWLIQQENIIAVPRALSIEQIKENIDLADFSLSNEQMGRISRLRSRNLRVVDPEVRRPIWDLP